MLAGLVVFVSGFGLGRYRLRQERYAEFRDRRIELIRPLPHYMHVVDFDPLERRPTVRLLSDFQAHALPRAVA